MINSFGATGYKSSPVVSFDVLVDIDLAVCKYCILHNTPEVDYDRLKTINYYQLIGLIYRRKCSNPLRVIAKDNITDDRLEALYSDLMDNQYDDILKVAVFTDMHKLLKEFAKSTDISPYILCYNDSQKALIQRSDLKNITVLSLNEAKNNKTQYYLRYLTDIEKFNEVSTDVTFYVSSCGLNLTEDNDDLDMDREEILKIAINRSKISIFDMYRMDIIGSYK